MDHSMHLMDSMNSSMHDHSMMTHDPPHVHPTSDGHEGHGDGGMDHMMMAMYFHFSATATILFKEWKTTSWEGMLASCIGVFLLAASYEGLKVAREMLLRRSQVNIRFSTVPVGSSDNTLITETHKTVGVSSVSSHVSDHESGGSSYNMNMTEKANPPSVSAKMISAAHAIQTFLHVVQVVVSYFLMLIFMTYNGWLCIAIALGAGTGYFIFSWKRAVVVDINEHCH